MQVRLFVTGTDTGVGKTLVSQGLLQVLAARPGVPLPFACKPFESGHAEPSDAELMRLAAGGWQPEGSTCFERLRAPLAPFLAAKLEGRRLSVPKVLRQLGALTRSNRDGVVEGAGGLHVPIDARHDVLHFMQRLGWPVVLVARAGLGTINHTTLSLDALKSAGLSVQGVVLVQASPAREPSVKYNRPELERRFPHTRFVGPVPFIADERRRLRVMRTTVAPLIMQAR